MIQISFRLGGDIILVEIDKNNLMFYDVGNNLLSDIQGLKFNRAGVIKEFPDLEFDNEWRSKSIQRFKEHFSSLKDEDTKVKYIIAELVKFGYTPMYKQRAGWRPIKII